MAVEQAQFLELMAEILEVEIEEIQFESKLEDLNWDSLAVITFMTEVHAEYDIFVTTDDVAKAKSIADLYALLS